MGWTEAAINFAFSDANGGEVVDWGNRDSVLYMVRKDGNNLVRAARRLRNNKEVVLVAVAQNGYALKYASRRLRRNVEIVRVAVEQYPDAIRYASPKLQQTISYADGKPVWKRKRKSK